MELKLSASASPHRNPEAGFTLLELLIALVVLAFGLMGVSGMIVSSVRGNAFSNQMMQATSLANQKIEDLRNISYKDLYQSCAVGGNPIVCADPPANMTDSAAPTDSGSGGDKLTGGAGDGVWTYTYNNAATPLPAGMTLVWGVKRNYPQPSLILLTACVVWGTGTAVTNECNLAAHTKDVHAVHVESIIGNF